MDVRVAAEAQSDLDRIWYFVATQSRSTDIADRLIDSITARFVPATKTCGQVFALSQSETA